MVSDSMPFRLSLNNQHRTLEDYLNSGKFSYFWVLKDGDPEVRAYLAAHGYRKVYDYTFTEKPATFFYEIYR